MALIDGHYILNEDVEGVSTYYIKYYDDIENKCKDMDPADKFKIVKKSNGKYKKDKSKYHEIKSYEFVRFMTSDQKPWSFDELNQLKNNTYELNDLFDDSSDEDDLKDSCDFSDEDDYYDYLNNLDIKDYCKYLNKKSAKDNYDINKVLESYDNDENDEDYEELNEYINEINYSSDED